MVAGIQGSRMNDQRADLPEFPGLHNQEEVIGQYMTSRREENDLDDQFFEMLMRCQVCDDRTVKNSTKQFTLFGCVKIMTVGAS